MVNLRDSLITHRIHVYYSIFTYIYHKKSTIHVGKYTVRPMDTMGTGNSALFRLVSYFMTPKHTTADLLKGRDFLKGRDLGTSWIQVFARES